jgi:hypothetical protein
VAKHLLDETAEFKLPWVGRHAADETENDVTENDLEMTQRIDRAVPRQQGAAGVPQDPAAR